MEKINLDLFDNIFYQIKGTKNQQSDVYYIDFKYETDGDETIIDGPDTYKQSIDLKKYVIEKIDFEIIKKEIDKDFGLIISELGEQNRIYLNKIMKNPNFSEKFDLNENVLLEKAEGDISKVGRFMVSKSNITASIIATEGRIGPAHWMLANQKTYDWFVKKIGTNLFTENNDKLFLANIAIDVNDSIEDDVLIEGRKSHINQPGLTCVILVDDDNNIIYEEDEITKEISIFFKIISYGFFPHKQFMKMNVEHESSNR